MCCGKKVEQSIRYQFMFYVLFFGILQSFGTVIKTRPLNSFALRSHILVTERSDQKNHPLRLHVAWVCSNCPTGVTAIYFLSVIIIIFLNPATLQVWKVGKGALILSCVVKMAGRSPNSRMENICSLRIDVYCL